MNMTSRTLPADDFDAIVVAELESLRIGERRLQQLYPRLQSQPQLRDRFLRELAKVQLRTDRLDAVLNPVSALEFPRLFAVADNRPVA
jgi:hypothetical protein